MGRGGCNCCGEWCTTGKINKNSGAFLWFYNYGVDTFNINLLDNSIYIQPRLGLRFDGSRAYHDLTVFNMRFFNTSNKFEKIGIDSEFIPKTKRISHDGQYLSETNYSTTMYDYRFYYYDYNDGYYNYFQRSDFDNQKRQATQSANNRTLIYNGIAAIFVDDAESADNIKASFLNSDRFPDSTNHTSDFPLVPRVLIGNSINPYNSFNGLYRSYGYGYTGSHKYLESVGNRYMQLDNNTFIDYITTDIYVNNIRNNNYVVNIEYIDSKVLMTLVFSADLPQLSSFSQFPDGLKKVSSYTLVGNSVYKLNYIESAVDYGYIEFDNSGYTFYPSVFTTNPIFDSIVIESYSLQESGMICTLSIDRSLYGNPLAISDIAKRFSLSLTSYYDAVFEEFASPIVSLGTFITRSVKTVYNLNLINQNHYGDNTLSTSIDIEQNNQYIGFNFGWDYSNVYQPYIRIFNLDDTTFSTITVRDMINESTLRDDIASSEGYTFIDIDTLLPSATQTMNLTATEYAQYQANPTEFILNELGMSTDALGIHVDIGHPFYGSHYYGAFYIYFWNYSFSYFWTGDFIKLINLGYDNGDIVLNAGIRVNKRLVYNHVLSSVTINYVSGSNWVIDNVDITFNTTFRFKELSPENNIYKFVFDSELNSVEYIEVKDTRLNYIKTNTQFNSYGYPDDINYYDYFNFYDYTHWWANSDRDIINSKTKAGITHVLRDNDNIRSDLARINLNVMSYSDVGAFIFNNPITTLDNTTDYANRTRGLIHVPFDRSHLYDVVDHGSHSGQSIISMVSGISSNGYGTYDIFQTNNDFIQNNHHNFTTFGSNGDVLYSCYIPKAVCLEVDNDGDAYVGTVTSSNRIAIYTGVAFVPANYTPDISCFVPEYESDVDDWIANLNLGDAYESVSCLWLIPDFSRDTIELDDNATVKVCIQNDSFDLGLFDTADEIQAKVAAMGYPEVSVYGGPIVDYPVCIAGFDSRYFTALIERVRTNDSVARFIAENSTSVNYTYEQFAAGGYYGLIPNTGDDRIYGLNVLSNSPIYNNLYHEWRNSTGYVGFDSEEQFRASRPAFTNFFLSQDGFLEPTFLFIDEQPDKITYDRHITIDEILSHAAYPEFLDLDRLRDEGNSNPSTLYHRGWLAKVENSTTSFKSTQANLYKVSAVGNLSWTSEYGYKPYQETNDTDDTTIEKNVYYNGIIQDLQLYNGELYFTGNMINLDAVEPHVFKTYSEYYNNIILTRNTEGQKRKYKQISSISVVDSLGVDVDVNITYYNLKNLDKVKPNVNPST